MTDSSQYHFIGSVESPRKAEIIVRSSNFSIDHILNRAGNNGAMMHQSIEHNFESINRVNNVNAMFVKSDTNFTPILDWLQYTRYHPPRLPRPMKDGPVKRTLGRLPRIPFTPYQLSELESAYRKANYMSSEDANKLAIKLDLTCTRVSASETASSNIFFNRFSIHISQVKIWFQNRRARERRENREASQRSLPKSPSASPKSQHSARDWTVRESRTICK